MRIVLPVVAALLLAGSGVSALQTGDAATEPFKPVFLQGGRTPPVLPPASPERDALKILVFMNTRGAACRDAATLLSRLARKFPRADFLAITFDPEAQCRAFLRDFPDFRIPFAREERPETTAKYMAGSRMFPMAFAVNRSGKIIWDGEPIDLEPVLEAHFSGKFNPARQERLAPLLSRLRILLYGGAESETADLTARIFALDPTNVPALRLRIYMLDTAGNRAGIERLLRERTAAAPGWRIPYFYALDLAPRLTELNALLARYPRDTPPDAAADAAFAGLLLTRQPTSPEALEIAQEVLARSTADTPEALGARALLAARLGNPEQALDLQTRATMLHRGGKTGGEKSSVALENYYRKVLELRNKSKKNTFFN